MNIVHLIMMFRTGGAETMLIDIMNTQIQDGNIVSLIIMNDDIVEKDLLDRLDSSIRVAYINRPKGSRNPWYVLKLNYILTVFHPDIVHCHNLAFANLIFSISTRRIFITDHNSGHDYDVYSRLTKVNKIFAISKIVRDGVVQRYGSKYNNVVLVENGVKIDAVKRKTDYSRRSPFRIVMVSRLYLKQKAQDVLLEALSYLVKSTEERILLDFIGTGSDELLIKGIVSNLGLDKEVRFLGNQSREYIYHNLCNYDLLVQSSRYEGFGLTVVEGMAAGLPVLVSDSEGPMEIIDSGNYGFYFKTGDAKDCADKIAEIMKMPDSYYLSAGERSVRRAEHYSFQNMIKKYYEYYDSAK